ncbi:hypothetical protein ASPCADRAFT_209191 [Aspergillus carbonarius ITEM 5010]|uniref:Uncharacterized protein n=1 Tax=Aspergillus carbonarius (strain ITEM 5010) TaxID=602072 RepID=A0A1R3RHI4_ASPC5|nr:hypothetical protein ASPCADRAFT_209191 [Aspergillus carbonarius ITEM 5010]
MAQSSLFILGHGPSPRENTGLLQYATNKVSKQSQRDGICPVSFSVLRVVSGPARRRP